MELSEWAAWALWCYESGLSVLMADPGICILC